MKFFRNFIAFLIILLSVFSSSLVYGRPLFPESVFSVTVSFPDPQILDSTDQQDYILLKGGYPVSLDQDYKLPVKVIFVDLPPETKLRDFDISHQQIKKYESIQLEKVIKSQSKASTPSSLTTIDFGDDFCRLAYLQKGNPHDTAVFVIRPFSYESPSKILTFTNSFQINLVVSPNKNGSSSLDVPETSKYHHCIVANLNKIPLFLDYKNFLEARGVSTLLFPYELITSYMGDSPQEQLRDALNSLYMKNGIESALIVGNNSSIPLMNLTIFGIDSRHEEVVPSDMFYADLSSDWDGNHNGYYGELDGDYVDYTNEIDVGRLPFVNDSQITSYLQRLMSFFDEEKDSRRKILTAGGWITMKEEFLETKDNALYDIDGGQIVYTNYRNYFMGFEHQGLYEHEGMKPSKVVNQGNALSYKNLISTLNNFDPLVILLTGHGNRTNITQKVWVNDNNNNKIIDFLEMKERSIIDLYSFDKVNKKHQSVVFADACSSINLEIDFNLGSEFLKKHAVGYVGSTANSYFFYGHDVNPSNYELNTSSFGLFANIEYYFSKEHTLGESINKGIQAYWNICNRSYNQEFLPKQIINIYGLNLYGDPLVKTSLFQKKPEANDQSQGSLMKGSNTYNIKEVFIGQDKNCISLKCQIFEKMANKNYQVALFVDSDNNPSSGDPESKGAEFFFVFGFNENQDFLYGCLQWSAMLNDWKEGPEGLFYNRFSFDYANSSVWVKIPKNLIAGSGFRYQFIFTHAQKPEKSVFPKLGEFADYPSKNPFPPQQPAIESLDISNRTIRITLSPFLARTYPVAGYELYRRVNNGEYDQIKTGGISELVIYDANYVPGATFFYKVRAYDNQNPTNYSLYSEEASIVIPKDPKEPDPTKPPQPVQLKGSYDANKNQITLTWSTPIPGSFSIAGLEIYRGVKSDNMAMVKTVDSKSLQFIDTNLQPDTTYYYYVVVFDNQILKHKSNPSNTVIVTTSKNYPPPGTSVTITLIVGEKYAYVNQNFMMLDIAPLMKQDRVFVPLRFIAEAFGAKVYWTEDASSNGEGTIRILYTTQTGSRLTIKMHTLEKAVYVEVENNGKVLERKTITLDAPPFIVKPANRTVVPIRFIAETFGASVEWKESNQSILIQL